MSTLARKAATKYSKKSSNASGNFSINGSANQSYIGKTNTNLSYIGCKQSDTSIKSSVKNYSGLRGTRIVNSNINNGIKCDPVNSYLCYTTLNPDLILNKHNLYNKDQSRYLDIKKNTCSVDRTTYLIDIAKIQNTCNSQTSKQKCNITKDMNKILGYTMGYDLYINDKVKKNCNYNPKDARNIAC
tara:strand:- start:4478 stop:5035 length:558 start_codon:yes stop_codon:yes gene_type:complete